MSLRSFFSKVYDPEDFAVYLSHDLSMLRLIETFAESSPQLVLMLAIILQRGQLDPETVLKAVGSASAVALSVTMYHRSLRSFLPEKENQPVTSSLVYFIWNLFLISSRLVALALFASVLPCFIFTHFLCSWLVLFFFVWRCKTKFMESAAGEWLYRATVGLIWYFTWFNVVEGKTRYRTLLYHGYKLADTSLLCGLWCWKMSTDPPYFEISHLNAVITAVCVVVVYVLGLFFKMIYYKFYHPNIRREQLKGDQSQSDYEVTVKKSPPGDVVDYFEVRNTITGASYEATPRALIEEGPSCDSLVTDRMGPEPAAPSVVRCNKRMRKCAENFYA